MRYVHGKDTGMTLLRGGTYTALPYTAETLRVINRRVPLAETVGRKKRAVFQETGKTVTGCFVTLITMSDIRELLSLITSPEESFDILMNRGYDKIIYRNLTIKSFELRGGNDENVKLKIKIKETEDSYTELFSPATPDLEWQREKTMSYMDYDFTAENCSEALGIYLFSFCGNYEEAASYTLQVNGPVTFDTKLTESEPLDELNLLCLIMTEEDTVALRIRFTDLCPASDIGGSDAYGEQLIQRLFNIDGTISIEVRGTNTYWGKEL